ELGRSFSREEDLPNGPRVVVLSHALWNTRFGGDHEILGKTISLSGDPYTVIGVIAPSFDVDDLGDHPDAWVPFQLDPATADTGHYFYAIGRIKPGLTLEQARAKMHAAASEFRARFPDGMRLTDTFSVEPAKEVLVGDVRHTLWVLLGAVVFVLL